MVEMLGVLAVIGVLSVGGIYGYTVSMAKNKANALLHEASQRASIISIQMLAEKDPAIGDFTQSGYGTFSTQVRNELGEKATYMDNYFVLTVSGVEKNVCNLVKASVGVGSKIHGFDPEECVDNATISLIFQKELKNSEAQCSSDADCGYCYRCNNSTCFRSPLCENACPHNTPLLSSSGTCKACPPDSGTEDKVIWGVAGPEECSKCSGYVSDPRNSTRCIAENCPDGNGYWLDGDTCRNCNGNWSLHSLTNQRMTDCVTKCPNRVVGQDGWGDACVLDNYCSGPNQFIDGWGSCYTCGEVNSYWDPDWGPCAQCPGISFSLFDYGDECVIDCPDNNYGRNVDRCCNSDEIYTDIGYSDYGHQYGACCPLTRPNWDGSKCIP